MKNKVLEEIRKATETILKREYPNYGLAAQDVGDSAGFRVHTEDGFVLKIDIEEIDKNNIF